MTVSVRYAKEWSTAPIVAPAECPHPGSALMGIGIELVAARPNGPRRITTKATFCMLCGTDASGQMTPEDAWEATWREHGWHASTGQRLLKLIGLENGPPIEGAAA